jgi:hypothetical protein
MKRNLIYLFILLFSVLPSEAAYASLAKPNTKKQRIATYPPDPKPKKQRKPRFENVTMKVFLTILAILAVSLVGNMLIGLLFLLTFFINGFYPVLILLYIVYYIFALRYSIKYVFRRIRYRWDRTYSKRTTLSL